jgi:hypothetical protein
MAKDAEIHYSDNSPIRIHITDIRQDTFLELEVCLDHLDLLFGPTILKCGKSGSAVGLGTPSLYYILQYYSIERRLRDSSSTSPAKSQQLQCPTKTPSPPSLVLFTNQASFPTSSPPPKTSRPPSSFPFSTPTTQPNLLLVLRFPARIPLANLR